MKRFFKCFVLLICTYLQFMLSAQAENIRFAQVTDAHISQSYKYSVKVLEATVKDINSQDNLSFVVFTGDNIGDATQENLKLFMETIKDLKIPYYIVLGNHDVYRNRNMSKKEYYAIVRHHNFLYPQRTPNYKFEKAGFVFIILDGSKEIIPGPSGYYRTETLDWFERQLTKYSKKQIVVFQHYPIEYPKDMEGRLKSHRTYKEENYKNILAKHHNVLAIISGHLHTNYETMNDGIYHIISPSLLTLPHSYKIIDIVTTKEFSPIIFTQLRSIEVNNTTDE